MKANVSYAAFITAKIAKITAMITLTLKIF